MSYPKTIKIYLVDGKPDGIKTAELSNWVGKAIAIPRNKLKDVKERKECNQPSIYFLFGKEDEKSVLPYVYIGEAEILWKRLITHESSKDFWQMAVAFVSKDNNLTKAHIKYLESCCLGIAKSISRCLLQNTSESALPNLSESDVSEMQEYLDNLKILLASLGYPILQEPATRQDRDVGVLLYCRRKGAIGIGRMTNEGFIVYKSSTASTQISDAVRKRNEHIISSLLQSGHISEISDKLFKFEKDYLFNSPSAASDLITGNSTSGWVLWKTKQGKILREVEKDKLKN